jgi:hypothetical protein
MRYTLTAIIIIATQFCAYTQNWANVGYRGEIYPTPQVFCPDTTNDKLFLLGFFYVDSIPSQTGISELMNGNDWQYALSQISSPGRKLVNFQGSYYACPLQGTYGVGKWDGSAWQDAGTSVGGVVYNLYNDGDSVLWALGSFSSIGSVPADGIAKFNGTSWTALDTATWGGKILKMCRYNGDIYFTGDFVNVPKDIYDITRWDGSLFHKVGNGIHGNIEFVQDMIVYGNELYVGGWFNYGVNGNPGTMIARWDGTQWSQVGGGMQSGQVNDFEIYNGNLWVAGAFNNAGGTTASMVARYDGLDWCDVGTFDISVSDLAVYQNELYLCGNFQTIDGDSVAHTVKWIGGNNTNGCGHLSTAIDESIQDFSVQVFPNPVTTNATFQFSISPGNKTLIIFDQLGKEIWRKETGDNQIEFSTQGFAAGLYFYSVQQNSFSKSGKIIIQ